MIVRILIITTIFDLVQASLFVHNSWTLLSEREWGFLVDWWELVLRWDDLECIVNHWFLIGWYLREVCGASVLFFYKVRLRALIKVPLRLNSRFFLVVCNCVVAYRFYIELLLLLYLLILFSFLSNQHKAELLVDALLLQQSFLRPFFAH